MFELDRHFFYNIENKYIFVSTNNEKLKGLSLNVYLYLEKRKKETENVKI